MQCLLRLLSTDYLVNSFVKVNIKWFLSYKLSFWDLVVKPPRFTALLSNGVFRASQIVKTANLLLTDGFLMLFDA